MPITIATSVVTYSPKRDRWNSDFTGVFSDQDFAISDEIDPSKQIKFDASGITAGTALTLTAPATSGTFGLKGDAGTLQYATPTAGQTVTITTADTLIMEPAGTLATLTVAFPAASDGKKVTIASTQIVTTLTLTANGSDAFITTLTAFVAGGFATFTARSTKWYRTG